MARPFVGSKPLKRLVGQSFGWQTAIGPRVNDWEGAPTTGTSPDDKYLLPVSLQSLEGLAEGTSTAGGILSTLNAIEGTANGTSTATGNLINLVFVPIEGTANGTSTATADLTAVPAPSSPSDAAGLPDQMRLVPVPTPATAADEGIFFLSNGAGGLNAGEPYWVPESSGTPVSLYIKTYVEDLAETLIFGDFTGGTDIIVSNGDIIRSENSGAGVPGRPVVLAPGSTVDTDVGALVWGTASSFVTRGKAAIDLQSGSNTFIVHPGTNYGAIVGGYHHTVGPPDGFGGGGAHYSGIFGGMRGYISAEATHSVIVGGGGFNLSNNIAPNLFGPSSTHNAIIASYEVFIQALTANTSFNFVHAVWGSYVYNTSYSAILCGSSIELGRSSDTQPNIDVFASGVFHDIWQGAGATHGNEAMAIFGRLNDTYSATNGAMFGRFLRLGTLEGNGIHGSCVGGNTNRLNSDYSLSWGSNNFSSGGYVGAYSLQFGFDGELNSSRHLSFGSHSFGSWPRGPQLSEYPRHGTTTDATPTDISPAGLRLNLASATGSTTGVSWNFEILVVARQTSVGPPGAAGDSAMWVIQGCIKYRSSTLTTTFVGVPTGTGTPSAFNDAGAALWDVSLTADDTNETLVLTVTGEVNKTIAWLARITASEVRGGL